VPFLNQRLKEAEKMGFKSAYLPVSEAAGNLNISLKPAEHITKAL
jgi:predicted ATP-dependent serine protease